VSAIAADQRVTRWQVPAVLAAVVLGLVVGLTTGAGEWAEALVLPALVVLLVLTFAGIHPDAVRGSIRPHPRTAVASLVLNFGVAPLLAGALGLLLLSDQPDLRVGLVMLLVTPCTDWYLVFTATARGNVALGAALLPVNLLLQLVLLPLFVVVLAGSAVSVPLGGLLGGVAIVLGIPLGLAVLTRAIADRAGAGGRLDALLGRTGPLSLGLLTLAIASIFAANARLVADEPRALARLLLPLLVFFVAAYLLAGATATRLALDRPERVTLTVTAMARNSPVALAVATAAFPDQPLIAVALVVRPLVELPVLSVAAHLLSRRPA
jgi:ACR3 family arsenite efflux pump ArsB